MRSADPVFFLDIFRPNRPVWDTLGNVGVRKSQYYNNHRSMGVLCRIDSISMLESFLMELGLEESISCLKLSGVVLVISLNVVALKIRKEDKRERLLYASEG
jgi:hypothetical protein